MDTPTTSPTEAARSSSAAPLLGVASRSPQVHALKTWPVFYAEVEGGRKPFEARKADRDYQVGDTLRLEEWNPETSEYTGRACYRRVTYILRGPAFGVEAGWVVLGLATPNSMNTETDTIHDSSANERHERNKRALAYLDALKHRDDENEQEWKEQWQARGLGCICILVFNTVLWYAVYCIAKALGEL